MWQICYVLIFTFVVVCFILLMVIVGSLRKGLRRLDRQVIEVEQGHEPGPFISCFHGWCDWGLLTKEFIDPRTIRFDQRTRMGMLGDMADYVGRPIEGLTTAQHEALAKEYKRRLERKKKAAKLRPQKESIRNRVRHVIRQKEEEKLEAASIAAGFPPKNAPRPAPDASYRSDYHVPPPDSIYASLSPRDEPSVTPAVSVASNPQEGTADNSTTNTTPPTLEEKGLGSPQEDFVSPLTPLTGESALTAESSGDKPSPDSDRLTSFVHTPLSKATPALRNRHKSGESFTQQIGISPPNAKKTPPRPSNPSDGATYVTHHVQPKTQSKYQKDSLPPPRHPSTPSTQASTTRRHTMTPTTSDAVCRTNGVAVGKARATSLKWSPEESNGLFCPAKQQREKLTPRSSVGSASGSNSTVPFVPETVASKLRRERNQSKLSSMPALSHQEEKVGRKPYNDYLRNPGTVSKKGEKSITRIITAAEEGIHQRRRSSTSKSSAGTSAEEVGRRNSASHGPPSL